MGDGDEQGPVGQGGQGHGVGELHIRGPGACIRPQANVAATRPGCHLPTLIITEHPAHPGVTTVGHEQLAAGCAGQVIEAIVAADAHAKGGLVGGAVAQARLAIAGQVAALPLGCDDIDELVTGKKQLARGIAAQHIHPSPGLGRGSGPGSAAQGIGEGRHDPAFAQEGLVGMALGAAAEAQDQDWQNVAG